MGIFWDLFFKDMAIREIHAYMRMHRNDIFSDYMAQYDDISDELEKIKIYIINKDEGTTDIKSVVQRYERQISELDRKVGSLSDTVKTFQDTINNLQKQLNKVSNIQPISQPNDEHKFHLLNSQIKNLESKINTLECNFEKSNVLKTKLINKQSLVQKEQSIEEDLIEKKTEEQKEQSNVGFDVESIPIFNKPKKTMQINNERDNEEQFDEYKTRIETLEQTVKEQSVIIKSQKDKINTLERNFENLNTLVEQLVNKQSLVSKEQSTEEDLIEKEPEEQYISVKNEEQKKQSNTGFDVESIPVFNKPKKTTQINIDDFLMPNPEKQYDIKKFDIVKTDKLFLSGDTSKIKIELQKALNMDNIIEFLQQSSLENKQAYLDIFGRYKRNVKKLIDKLSINEDDEEIWEKLTEKFFGIVKNDILSNFMIGIYRGIKSRKEGYELFLNEINKYLTYCCIYTRYIHPDVKYIKNDFDDMVALKKETDDLNKNDYIDEVERLPYYIDYLNEDEERKFFCYDGKFVVLKCKEKNKED